MIKSRFRGWLTFGDDERAAASDDVVAAAGRLEGQLRAFAVMKPDDGGERRGVLAHLPYAAKDMLVAPDHVPGCGLARPRQGPAPPK